MRRAALLLFGATLGLARAEPATHPFPWITGEQLLQKLDRPKGATDAAEAVAYLKGTMDATADRQWCYSKTKPGTGQVQPALTDFLRSLPTPQLRGNAALLAVQAWQARWPCTTGCCHV